MPCRVGITTDQESRRVYWKNRVIGFTNWRILTSFPTKAAAQQYENDYAAKFNCNAWPGGPDATGTWYVYRFEYTSDPG